MSISTEITRLTNAKTSIKTAIEGKGVTVPSATKLDGYGSLISTIQTGIEPVEATYSQVNNGVSAYITAAKSTYTIDNDTITIMPTYESQGNDTPNGYASSASGNITTVDNGTKRNNTNTNATIYNIAPTSDGGSFCAETNGVINACGTLKPTGELRMIFSPSVDNVRDLGGWTCDGGKIKYGKIFRGGRLRNSSSVTITNTDKDTFRNLLGIACEIDYMIASEGGDRAYSELGNDIYYVPIPMPMLWDSSAWYTQMIDVSNTAITNKWKTALRKIFECAKYNRPVYYHCSAGADRTGICSFIIESLLGVSKPYCDIDYELTSFSDNAGRRVRNAGYYINFINYLKQCSTSSLMRDCVVAWCVLIGIDIAEINEFRHNVIDGNPADVTAQVNYGASSITLNSTSGTIEQGGTVTLTATLTPSWATSPITWVSADTAKATVAGSGNMATVTGVGVGTTTITATANGLSATYTVTITQSQDQPQYTGNIVPQVGYTDGKRYKSSTGITTDYASFVAVNLIPYHLQNDGRFRLSLSGATFTATTAVAVLYKNGTYLGSVYGYVMLNGGEPSSNQGVFVNHIDSTHIEITATTTDADSIGICCAGTGASLVIEQVFPIGG